MCIKKVFQTVLFLCVLTSCTSKTNKVEMIETQPIIETSQIEEALIEDKCISPIFNEFSYPTTNFTNDLPIPGRTFFVAPQDPWVEINELPKIEGKDNYYVDVLYAREVKNYTEVWTRIYFGEIGKDDLLAIYRTDLSEWRLLNVQINDLFEASDGGLWGVRYYSSLDVANDSFLFRYNEDNGVFVPEEGTSLPLGSDFEGNFYPTKVIFDKHDVFWLVVPNDGIYSYNPIEKKVVQHIEISFLVTDAELNIDGKIYMFTPFKEESGTSFLRQFTPGVQEIEDIPLSYILEPHPTPSNILIDDSGRLWLDNVAYLDSDGIWYQIQRSPVFVSISVEAYNDYRYKNAQILLESSDGRLWFRHRDNGGIYLNPKSGEWCWFTTYQSNIVEDSNQNLWMIADNKLYMLPLNQ